MAKARKWQKVQRLIKSTVIETHGWRTL